MDFSHFELWYVLCIAALIVILLTAKVTVFFLFKREKRLFRQEYDRIWQRVQGKNDRK